MATSVTVRVDGLRELGERMRRLSSEVALKVSARATNKAAQLIKKQAKSNIQTSPSVDQGDLLRSVIVKKIPKSQTNLTSEHIVTVRGRGKKVKEGAKAQATAPHAHLVEFGTVHMPAEPFLRPAFQQEKGFAFGVIKSTLEEGIEKAAKR